MTLNALSQMRKQVKQTRKIHLDDFMSFIKQWKNPNFPFNSFFLDSLRNSESEEEKNDFVDGIPNYTWARKRKLNHSPRLLNWEQSKIHKQMNALTFIPSIDVSAKRMCLKPHMQPFLLLHGIDLYLSLFRSLPLFPFSPLLSH